MSNERKDHILFTHNNTGQLEDRVGKTSFIDIMALGAIHLGRHDTYIDDHVNQTSQRIIKYPTDREGLERISDKGRDLTRTLVDAIGAISTAMVHTNRDELDYDMEIIFWLITGLSELAQQTEFACSEMDHHLKEGYK